MTSACTAPGVDPDLFTSRSADDVKKAKAICATCPVIEACLKAALERGEDGVWGGTTLAERKALVGKPVPRRYRLHNGKSGQMRRPINHGTVGGYATHRKRGEVACRPCKDATTAYQKQLRVKASRPKPQEETT